MSPPDTHPRIEEGTFTSLLNEVFRGTGDERTAWVDGLAAGTALGRYDLIREIGRGGSGVVWEARDRELGRRVAVKVIRIAGTGTVERRLVAEAEVAARLSHPGIVTILDVGRNEHGAWLVQEFLTGETLSARIARGPLPLREALDVALAVSSALAHAHAHGVVHRDLSDRNVFLCADGQVKLLDLGMAQAFGKRKLEGGSPSFMAPEQAAGAPEDERTDVFALGVLIFRMLTGESPAPPPPPGKLPAQARGIAVPEAPALAALVEGMLSRDPLDRPRDAGAVTTALEEIEAGLPRGTGTQPGISRTRSPARRRWMASGALLAIVLLGVPLGAWTVLRRPAPPANVIYSASAATAPCSWDVVSYDPLERLSPGVIAKNGDHLGQGPVRRDGRLVWFQQSDWNHLFVPTGGKPDIFAVQASFFLPETKESLRGAGITVFTDPEGPDAGNALHGRSIRIMQEPGRAAYFTWGFFGGPGRTQISHSGVLPVSNPGTWHRLRIEGSRVDCWLRAYLDDTPLLLETGMCDLGGGYTLLQASAPHWESAEVAWKDLNVFSGGVNCR